ncbi:MAG: hypothetical protein OXQ92_06265 [Boseongicola sp.]|nr:hypothetical protein [Boseongicola sp.]MDD9979520.1 hypothetical protein [Boseongicola sp.]
MDRGQVAMTPITEDQVLSLMKGLEARERAAMKNLKGKVPASAAGGSSTARILPIEAKPVRRLVSEEQTRGDVVALENARQKRRERRTIHGQFIFRADAALS